MVRWILAVCLMLWAGIAGAQEFSALARIDANRSEAGSSRKAAYLRLHLSQPVPYRVFILDRPRRLVVDFKEAEFDARLSDVLLSDAITGVNFGRFQPGWSRMVLDLAQPYRVETANMETGAQDGSAIIDLRLVQVPEEDFAANTGFPPSHAFPEPALADTLLPPVRDPGGPPVIVIDPGHGGIDPGAVRGEVREADLVLEIALDLANYLSRTGNYEVILTRESDHFVSLEGRIAIARRAGADVFLSLHADAISQGTARGAQVYTLDEDAQDAATQQLVERHERGEILAGVDLAGQDDRIAAVLLSLAQVETGPRTDALADALVAGLTDAGVRMHRRARDTAAFSVLKAPDVPSVLLEIGFLSSPEELAKLQDPAWREQAIKGIALGLAAWIEEDAAREPLRRQ